jgi:hypothetical protein
MFGRAGRFVSCKQELGGCHCAHGLPDQRCDEEQDQPANDKYVEKLQSCKEELDRAQDTLHRLLGGPIRAGSTVHGASGSWHRGHVLLRHGDARLTRTDTRNGRLQTPERPVCWFADYRAICIPAARSHAHDTDQQQDDAGGHGKCTPDAK